MLGGSTRRTAQVWVSVAQSLAGACGGEVSVPLPGWARGLFRCYRPRRSPASPQSHGSSCEALWGTMPASPPRRCQHPAVGTAGSPWPPHALAIQPAASPGPPPSPVAPPSASSRPCRASPPTPLPKIPSNPSQHFQPGSGQGTAWPGQPPAAPQTAPPQWGDAPPHPSQRELGHPQGRKASCWALPGHRPLPQPPRVACGDQENDHMPGAVAGDRQWEPSTSGTLSSRRSTRHHPQCRVPVPAPGMLPTCLRPCPASLLHPPVSIPPSRSSLFPPVLFIPLNYPWKS